MRKRGAIVAKLMAQNLSKAGFCHFITVDLHQKEIQGFFDCTIDNLRASPYLIASVGELIFFKISIILRNFKKLEKTNSYRLNLSKLENK